VSIIQTVNRKGLHLTQRVHRTSRMYPTVSDIKCVSDYNIVYKVTDIKSVIGHKERIRSEVYRT